MGIGSFLIIRFTKRVRIFDKKGYFAKFHLTGCFACKTRFVSQFGEILPNRNPRVGSQSFALFCSTIQSKTQLKDVFYRFRPFSKVIG